MKKILPIILLHMFLIANSHMAISIHCCGGKITNIDINCESDSKCSCGEVMAPGCCNDVHVKAKFSNSDYKTSDTKIHFLNTCIATELLISERSGFIHNHLSVYTAYSSYHAPPILKGPVFLLYCNILV